MANTVPVGARGSQQPYFSTGQVFRARGDNVVGSHNSASAHVHVTDAFGYGGVARAWAQAYSAGA